MLDDGNDNTRTGDERDDMMKVRRRNWSEACRPSMTETAMERGMPNVGRWKRQYDDGRSTRRYDASKTKKIKQARHVDRR
jgi:hypothetical protein